MEKHAPECTLAASLMLAIGVRFGCLVCASQQRYRWADGLAFRGVIGIWLAATPIVAESLAGALERRQAPAEHV